MAPSYKCQTASLQLSPARDDSPTPPPPLVSASPAWMSNLKTVPSSGLSGAQTAQAQTWHQRARRLLLRSFVGAYPSLHAVREGLAFLYQLMYLLEGSPYFSPSLHVLQQRIVRVTGQELVRAAPRAEHFVDARGFMAGLTGQGCSCPTELAQLGEHSACSVVSAASTHAKHQQVCLQSCQAAVCRLQRGSPGHRAMCAWLQLLPPILPLWHPPVQHMYHQMTRSQRQPAAASCSH